MKSKILIVGGFPSDNNQIFGGIVTSCQALMKSSFSKRFDVITIDSTQIQNPIPTLFIRFLYAFKRSSLYFFKLLFKRPDVVILFPAIGASLVEKGVMSWLAFFLRIPVLMFPRGGPLLNQVKESAFTKFWVKIVFSSSTMVLCQGPAWKNFAMEVLGFSDNKSPIIFNWTATDSLLAIGEEKLTKETSLPLNILFLGWVEKEKGIFDLLDVCLDLKEDYKFKVSIAGGGSCEETAKKIAINNNLDVRFYGWVDRTKLKYIFENADILVLPSWAEGFPNAIIEAMASGVPVIVSSVGNIPDIIKHKSEALLVPPKNKNALRASIINLIESDELRNKLSRNGHEFASRNFSVEKAAIKLEQIIKSIL